MALTVNKLSVKKLTLRRPGVDTGDVLESGPEDRPGSVDRALVVASSILLPLGLVSILLAWYGASRTPNLFEQVPYLISGGLLGLAFVIGAGVCYVGSWVTRGARDQRAASSEIVALLTEIRDGLADTAAAPALPTQPTSRRRATGADPDANGQDGAPRLVATASGSMLHRPDCAVVASRPDVRDVSESTPGLSPCRLCDPLSTVQL